MSPSSYMKITLLTIILLSLFPVLLFFFFFPFYIYRELVKLWAYHIHTNGKLGKIITTRATLFSTDELYKSNPKCNVVMVVTVKGKLDVLSLRETFLKTTLSLRNPSGTGLWYPELQQSLYKFGGYFFWKDVDNFKIENHIINHSNNSNASQRFGDDDVRKTLEELANKTWRRNAPLWELICANNYCPKDELQQEQDPYSVVFFRFHHVLCDGQAIFTLFIKNFLQSKDSTFTKPMKLKRNLISKIIHLITFPYRGAFAFVRIVMQSRDPYPWNVPFEKQTKVLQSLPPSIPIQIVKDIKDKFNVSFSSVILAAITGAHRETIIKRNKNSVPRRLPCFSPFPLEKHSGKLRNLMGVVIINLPVKHDKPIERLQKCHKIYENIRNSPEPIIFGLLSLLMGLLPDKLYRVVLMELQISTGLSTLPVGLNELSYHQRDETFSVERVFYGAGLLIGSTGAGLTFTTYKDKIYICGGAYESLMSQEELNEFTSQLHKQLNILVKEDIV